MTCAFAALTVMLLLYSLGCGGSGQEGGSPPGPHPSGPREAVQDYLRCLDRGDYLAALSLLEDPASLAWPSGPTLNRAAAEKAGDGLDLESLEVGEAWMTEEGSGEFLCLASCWVKPGPAGDLFGIGGKEGNFFFAVLQRQGEWRISRGGPIPKELYDFLSTKPMPFRNCLTTIPGEARRGEKYRVSFDLHLRRALSRVEEVSIVMAPEPGVAGYPRAFETAFSTYWYDVGGARKPLEHFDVEVEVDGEAVPGRYRLYLALGTSPQLLWPLPPFTVTVR